MGHQVFWFVLIGTKPILMCILSYLIVTKNQSKNRPDFPRFDTIYHRNSYKQLAPSKTGRVRDEEKLPPAVEINN